MSTQLFLTSTPAAVGGSGGLKLSTGRGAASATAITTTTASGTNIPVTASAGGTALSWWFQVGAGTISGNVSANIRARESSTAVNAGLGILIERYASDGTTLLGTILSDRTVPASITELTTSDSAKALAAVAPTSTTMSDGDWIKVTIKIRNVGTMAAGTATLSYNGPTAGAAGDSYVTFTDNLNLYGGSAIAPPTRTDGAQSTAYGTSATPQSTSSFDVQSGDLITLIAASEDAGGTIGTPSATGGSITWTLWQSYVVSSYCPIYLWIGTVGSTATGITVSMSRTAGSQNWGFAFSLWRNHGGLGSTSKSTNLSGAPSLLLPLNQDHSAVIVGSMDWTAQDGTSRTWRSVNGSAITETVYILSPGAYSAYQGYALDTGTDLTETVGLSAPGGQKYTLVAAEVLGVPGSGTTPITPLTRASGWAVRSSISKTRAVGWAVRSAITAKTRASNWAARTVVATKTRAETWATRAGVAAKTRAITWDVAGDWTYPDNNIVDFEGIPNGSSMPFLFTNAGDFSLDDNTSGSGTATVTTVAGEVIDGGASGKLHTDSSSVAYLYTYSGQNQDLAYIKARMRITALPDVEFLLGFAARMNGDTSCQVTIDPDGYVWFYAGSGEGVSTSVPIAVPGIYDVGITINNDRHDTPSALFYLNDAADNEILAWEKDLPGLDLTVGEGGDRLNYLAIGGGNYPVLSGEYDLFIDSVRIYSESSLVVITNDQYWDVAAELAPYPDDPEDVDVNWPSLEEYAETAPVGSFQAPFNLGINFYSEVPGDLAYGINFFDPHGDKVVTPYFWNKSSAGAVEATSSTPYTTHPGWNQLLFDEPFEMAQFWNYIVGISVADPHGWNEYLDIIGYSTAGVDVDTDRFTRISSFTSLARYDQGPDVVLGTMPAQPVDSYPGIELLAGPPVLVSVGKTISTTWSVRTGVTDSLSSTWAVRQAISPKSRGVGWAVRAGVAAKTRASSWAVQAGITAKTRSSAWSVRATIVAKTRASNWAVRSAVATKTRASSWAVRTSVAVKTRASAWAVRSSVATKTRASNWATRSGLSKTRSVTWVVRQAVSQTRATSWYVYNLADNDVLLKTTSWNVRQGVSDSISQSWSTRTAVSKSLTSSWAVRARVTDGISTNWSVRSLTSALRASSWSVRTGASKTRSTSWNVETTQLVVMTRSATWAVRQAVSKSRSTIWGIRTGLGSSWSTTWAVRQAVSTGRGITWAIRLGVIQSRAEGWNVQVTLVAEWTTSWSVRVLFEPYPDIEEPTLELYMTQGTLGFSMAQATLEMGVAQSTLAPYLARSTLEVTL